MGDCKLHWYGFQIDISSDLSRVIFDARVAFEIQKGYAITFMFATEEVVAKWAKIALPNTIEIKRKVDELESLSTHIGFNFEFKGCASD